ncbi:hypothetical protein HMPREF9075_02389 [Capnocytophaga sp. oral taxon 332 str. F0381]|uniref:hypothetical protein n=1 Tax=Capnocytophaga sp. oral taxon 332 TaxID=712213 RepID=UPI0002A40CD6|nr:hypothetical protein [Capnocytophaga sp. oral taxon 332]EKY06354.1 hypothetical protein HMPREF9075_02389 [Capnocytophaga sp. oral taxon 332 str. F0381]
MAKVKSKSKSKKEYIFIREKYKKDKYLFDEWEKYDSISKRILCYSGKYNYCKVEYIRVKEEDEITVISLIREKINVFQNSEFIKKNCEAYIKINNKEKKVTTKKWLDVLYEIKILIKDDKRNDRILDLLEIDFLAQKDKKNYSEVFSYISNETILKNLMLKKITNEKNLFKAYFKSRFNNNIDKLPLSKAKEIIKREDSNLFFRILRTSKNPHITINNYNTILKYPHIEDLSLEAHYLKEKINYNRSHKSLNEIHSEMSNRILEVQIQFSKIENKNIYQLAENIPIKHNIYLLQTELDFFREGKLQKNCIYSYYQSVKYPPLEKSKKRSKEDISFFFSYREATLPEATLEVVFKWDYKAKKFEDHYWFKQIYGKRNTLLKKTFEEKIERDFEKYYREVLTKQLIPID